MPFSINHYAQLRPFLYHLTAQANQLRIQSLQCLESAALLFAAANRADALRERRRSHMHIPIDGHQIMIRDQTPLHAGNTAFADGWGLPALIADLNCLASINRYRRQASATSRPPAAWLCVVDHVRSMRAGTDQRDRNLGLVLDPLDELLGAHGQIAKPLRRLSGIVSLGKNISFTLYPPPAVRPRPAYNRSRAAMLPQYRQM
jgi:hypothetical protein